MKLASLQNDQRDGQLVVVDRQLEYAIKVDEINTLQYALDNWEQCYARLSQVYTQLNQQQREDAFKLDLQQLTAPLPRAYQWLDGSAYLSHVKRVRQARGAKMPDSFLTDPLMYQGASDNFLGPYDPISLANEDWGLDLEAEICVITDDVPQGTETCMASSHIKLLLLTNDISLRNLIPNELAKGFGFIHGKPSSSFSPVAITPDELGSAWHNGKVLLPLVTHVNGKLLGKPHAGSGMQFSFPQLIHHAAKSRHLGAGTIIGSGTISNEDPERGCCCLVEKRVMEIINNGEAQTEFLKHGDEILIEMFAQNGESLFGSINQKVILCLD